MTANTSTIAGSNNSANAASAQDDEFFNLHTSGVGYLNRVRWVPSRTGKYLSCSIAALRGKKSDKLYTHYDVNVKGEEALRVIAAQEANSNDKNTKVFIGFLIGDEEPTSYTDRDGVIKHQNKGRLLSVNFITVNGDRVYTASKAGNAKPAESAPASAPVPTPTPAMPSAPVQAKAEADADLVMAP